MDTQATNIEGGDGLSSSAPPECVVGAPGTVAVEGPVLWYLIGLQHLLRDRVGDDEVAQVNRSSSSSLVKRLNQISCNKTNL